MTNLNSQSIQLAFDELMSLSTNTPRIDIEVVEETGSTNFDLMKKVRLLTKPSFLIAKHQTAGRGRAGRSWQSIPHGALTFSLAWNFQKTPNELMGLPLVLGVAIAEKLNQLGVPTKLKWPNDLMKDGKKLGGILVESLPGNQGTWAVMGVGLNLRIPNELEDRIGQPVADAPWLAQMNPNLLTSHLLHALTDVMTRFENDGFKVFVDRWNGLDAYKNQSVIIVEQGIVQHQGDTLGVDEFGRLILQTPKGIVAVHSGDVSLRLS